MPAEQVPVGMRTWAGAEGVWHSLTPKDWRSVTPKDQPRGTGW